MNVFAQRLSCMRYTCRIIKLYYKRNYSCVIDSFSKRKLSTSMWSRTRHVALTQLNPHWNRDFAVLATDHQHVVDNEAKNLSVDSQKMMRENDYGRKLFLNSIHYKNTVMQQNTTYIRVTNNEALEILEQKGSLILTQDQMLTIVKKLSYNILYSKESIKRYKYKNIFNLLPLYFQKLSNDDLLILIKHLVPFRELLQDCSFYKTFCDYLDVECIQRFSNLSINETLLFCDTMYLAVCPSRRSQYIWYSIGKLGAKPRKLTPHQLVQVLFFLNVCEKPAYINMYELEYWLEQYMDDLSINELGIAILGFCGTDTPIRSEFLHRIIKKTIAEVDTVDSVSIEPLFKQIRYRMKSTQILIFQELLNALASHISRFTLMSLTHIAHACTEVALYDKIIDKIIERLNSELKTTRLRDIEEFMFVFSCLNIDPSNSIYNNVIEELRIALTTWNTSRSSERWEYSFTDVASHLLGSLAVLGIYPTDLIEEVMEPNYNSDSDEEYDDVSSEYCVFHYGAQVEVPEYHSLLRFSLLSDVKWEQLLQEHLESSMSSEEESRANELLTSVLKTCKELFNTTSNISVARSLPHYLLPDIVFCLNKQNQLVPTSEFMSQFYKGIWSDEIKRVDQDVWNDVRWIALVIGPSFLLLKQSNLPTGPLAAKIRQLSKIGYTPILISEDNWVTCRSTEEKCNYIKYLIFKNNVSETV